jgi:hypothetical protein
MFGKRKPAEAGAEGRTSRDRGRGRWPRWASIDLRAPSGLAGKAVTMILVRWIAVVALLIAVALLAGES